MNYYQYNLMVTGTTDATLQIESYLKFDVKAFPAIGTLQLYLTK
jgi:hypothetical protein